MPRVVPSDLKVLAFDVFGTVVDWRSRVGVCRKPIP
jgi:hypothetical protein